MNLIPAPLRTPDDQIARRLELCRGCEFHGTAPVVRTEFCKACGCPLLNKTKFLHSKCPKGKW